VTSPSLGNPVAADAEVAATSYELELVTGSSKLESRSS